MKKAAAVLGLVIMGLGLASTLYGYAAEITTMRLNIRSKATKVEVNSLHNKLDSVILGLCIIDKRTCILKERRR